MLYKPGFYSGLVECLISDLQSRFDSQLVISIFSPDTLSYDVASGSDITPYIQINKPLVNNIFWQSYGII